tara:strand:- start:11017 stop:11868 length:852 start_codon:yes stop_codon:yes gene_type:complete
MIFISTGGFNQKKGTQAYRYLREKGFKNIEFSGGKFIKNFNKKIKDYKNNSQIHNYFPPPKKPFVLNLSSKNKVISSKSINLVKKNIINSKKIGSKFYSFHAGFRIDPNFKELGKQINNRMLISKKEAMKIFFERVVKLSKFANKHGVKLFIENNVISKKNLKRFRSNPFLLTTPSEIISFFNKLPKNLNNIGLLLDVAHLKVSSRTLKFNLQKSHKSLRKYINAYHLSDNNGIVDSNKKFSKNAWFWKHFKKNTDFITIEVYNASDKDYSNLVNIVEKKLSR